MFRSSIAIIVLSIALLVPYGVDARNVLADAVSISAERAASIKTKGITFALGSKKWVLSAKQARSLFKITKQDDGLVLLRLRVDAVYSYLNIYISPQVNDIGEHSRFVGTGDAITLVKGGRKGKIVDGVKTSLALRKAFTTGGTTVAVAMKEYRPAMFSVEDFKKIKFPDLIATSTTSFAGSPKNRVHNIVVGTQRFNGVIVMPNEEFSFNKYLGSVDAGNGYLPELVIKENVTTPAFGGGICQISTTVFRASMFAGLDITNRRNHSYPVSYYGAPGFDATIYLPAPDFQFRNDMKTPVLLKTSVVGSKVTFEVWGTNDGRTVKINGPFTTEKKPDGSLTAAVAQIVTKGGKIIREENFVSKYQSADKFPEVRAANREKNTQ